jgi:hypothetical protein
MYIADVVKYIIIISDVIKYIIIISDVIKASHLLPWSLGGAVVKI